MKYSTNSTSVVPRQIHVLYRPLNFKHTIFGEKTGLYFDTRPSVSTCGCLCWLLFVVMFVIFACFFVISLALCRVLSAISGAASDRSPWGNFAAVILAVDFLLGAGNSLATYARRQRAEYVQNVAPRRAPTGNVHQNQNRRNKT